MPFLMSVACLGECARFSLDNGEEFRIKWLFINVEENICTVTQETNCEAETGTGGGAPEGFIRRLTGNRNFR